MREMLAMTATLKGAGLGAKVALVTRWSLQWRITRVVYRTCGSRAGGRRPDWIRPER